MNLLAFKEKHGTDRIRAVAEEIGTSYAYLSQVMHGHRKASSKLALKMVNADAAAGDLSLSGVRPDIWGKPEALETREAAANG